MSEKYRPFCLGLNVLKLIVSQPMFEQQTDDSVCMVSVIITSMHLDEMDELLNPVVLRRCHYVSLV